MRRERVGNRWAHGGGVAILSMRSLLDVPRRRESSTRQQTGDEHRSPSPQTGVSRHGDPASKGSPGNLTDLQERRRGRRARKKEEGLEETGTDRGVRGTHFTRRGGARPRADPARTWS